MEETHFVRSPVQQNERFYVAFVIKWFRRKYYVFRSIEPFNTVSLLIVKIRSVGKICVHLLDRKNIFYVKTQAEKRVQLFKL